MKKLTALLMAAMMAVSVSACTPKETKVVTDASGKTMATYTAMKGDELNKIMEDNKEKEKYLVIDVRSAEEYKAGHVKFAINMNVDNLEKELSLIDGYKDKDVVTICNTGKKSAKAAEILTKNGFKKVHNADGVKSFSYKTMTKVTNIIGSQLQKLADEGKYTIVDVRDEKDYKEGHLKGAISIPADQVEAKMSTVMKDKPVAFYCYSGNKSFAAASKFADAGYETVNSLDGTKEYKFNLEK